MLGGEHIFEGTDSLLWISPRVRRDAYSVIMASAGLVCGYFLVQ